MKTFRYKIESAPSELSSNHCFGAIYYTNSPILNGFFCFDDHMLRTTFEDKKNHPPSWWSLFLGFGYEKYNLTSFFFSLSDNFNNNIWHLWSGGNILKNFFYVKTFIQSKKMSKKDQSYTFKTVYKWILF